MGFEPTTTTLATWCSTPELLPRISINPPRPPNQVQEAVANRRRFQYSAPLPDCKTRSVSEGVQDPRPVLQSFAATSPMVSLYDITPTPISWEANLRVF
jgi:hypothetical protein